jgi:putative transcriptional regulator
MEGRGGIKVHLRRYRFEADEMTQQDLAERVGVTRQTIISIEKGKYQPSVELALRLAKILQVSVDQIFELEQSWEETT